jgi:PAS domain S-box-containing protein
VASAGAPVTDPGATDEGRQLFATFRAGQAELVSQLQVSSTIGLDLALDSTLAMLVIILVGSILVAFLLRVTATRVARQGLEPLRELAGAARQIATEGQASIPNVGDQDEVGELARALQGWQDVSAVRTILVEQAPVGICQIDAEGCFQTTNEAYEMMLGYSRTELVGRAFWTFLDPADVERAKERHEGLMRGDISHYEIENRWLRKEGSVAWFSMVAASVLGVDGRPQTLVGIMEDITERKLQAERAAWIQRELLPKEQPELKGYELAAACLPAQDVGGDFYDWVGPEEDGQLDITVADVMGKGAGSALIMATLRTALRTAPHELGPAARVSLVAESMSRGLTDDGLFVTLFHARLDTRSGLLRYVDGGHGYCVVRRVDGELERLSERSLPLGVRNMERFKEGEVELGPGDLLLAYTDGLVEVGERTLDLGELTGELESAAGAGEMVERLVATVRGEQGDDVTVMVLRRDDTPVPIQKLTG